MSNCLQVAREGEPFNKKPSLIQIFNDFPVYVKMGKGVNFDDLQIEFITRLTIDFQDLKNILNSLINTLLNYGQNSSFLQRGPKFIPELPNYDLLHFQRTGQILPRNTPDATPRRNSPLPTP